MRLDLPTANAIEKSYMAPPRERRPLCANLSRLLRGTFEGRRDLALRVTMSQPGTCATNRFWNSHLIKVLEAVTDQVSEVQSLTTPHELR